MATPASPLEDDLSCSVCCDIFREPVLLGCGHSFCRECLSRHWSSSNGRRCPVCRRSSPQPPLLNISLRSTCESFLQQQQQQQQKDANEAQKRKKEEDEEEEEKKEERARLCPEHGQRLAFFCEKEQQLVCSQCKKNGHRGHRVLSVQKAVKERQAKLSTAMTPLKQRLDLLTSGTTQSTYGMKDIKSQTEDTERKIKKDFEELHKFLLDEEASRLSALTQEAESCSTVRKAKTSRQIGNLSQKLKDLEDKMEAKDAIGFLQNFDSILKQAQTPEPEDDFPSLSGVPALNFTESQLSIDVARHLGNLKFRVWERMRSRAPYYPVTLDPNAHLCFLSLTDDLASVSRVDKEWCLCPVPGSEGIADDNFHSWDVDVGDENAEWMLGVMTHRFIHGLLPVCPEMGFWAIQRSGGEFQALTAVTSVTGLHLTSRPRVVRVQLWRPFTLRALPTRRQGNSKTHGWISMQFSGKVQKDPRKKCCDQKKCDPDQPQTWGEVCALGVLLVLGIFLNKSLVPMIHPISFLF
ncbi:E3 ubiquitin-protein ligase TRIM39-like isoform X2 [Sardina pilchardus]|uniref:E3 ubiquitin-protein ligase TRIM39-like isoform X2 n=1 Tax=Sardina pilchardus TaxID=27697 RepID=UPI002E148AA8